MYLLFHTSWGVHKVGKVCIHVDVYVDLGRYAYVHLRYLYLYLYLIYLIDAFVAK